MIAAPWRVRGAAPFALVALLALAAQARAEPPLEVARRLYVEGEQLKPSRPAAALARFEQAYALVPTPLLLLRQAEAYRALGRPAEALRAARQVDAEALPPQERRSLERLRAELLLAPPAPAPPARSTGKWILGGLAVLAIAIGGGVALAGRPSCGAGGCSSGLAPRAVGLGLIGGGAAGLGGAAAWFLLERSLPATGAPAGASGARL